MGESTEPWSNRTLVNSNINIEYRGHEIVLEVIYLSAHKIVSKERDNAASEPCFLQNESEEIMV